MYVCLFLLISTNIVYKFLGGPSLLGDPKKNFFTEARTRSRRPRSYSCWDSNPGRPDRSLVIVQATLPQINQVNSWE